MTNRNRPDGDPSFTVNVRGFSRARWNLVLKVLQEWNADASHKKTDHETYSAVEEIMRALKSHILDGGDGYELGGQQYREPTELEKESLQSARIRHEEEKRQTEEFARSLGFEPFVEHKPVPWITGPRERKTKTSRVGTSIKSSLRTHI